MTPENIAALPRYMPTSEKVYSYLNNIEAWDLNKYRTIKKIEKMFSLTHDEVKSIYANWEHGVMSGKCFELICCDCSHKYEGWHNNSLCPICWDNKNIEWMLRPQFKKLVPDPVGATLENFHKNIEFSLEVKL